MVFQIALLAFAFGAIIKTWRQYRRKEVSKYWATSFTLLWVVVIVVAAIPNSTNAVANFVGIGRGADMIVYSAIVILTYAVYRLIIREQRLSEEMTELVRAVAIEKAHKPE